jgi:hypothetical protein
VTRGVFFDRNHQPSSEEIQQALGECYPLWEKLIRFIATNYQIEGVWSSYGPAGFGCGFRYKTKGKALIALYPQKDQIIAQVVLGKTQAEMALSLELGNKVREIIMNAPQGHDGRWLSIPVHSIADAEVIEQLMLVKMKPVGKGGDR